MKKVNIQGLIFDWGGVLIHNPLPEMLKYFAGALGKPLQSIRSSLLIHHEDFQSGALTEKEFWSRMCNGLHIPPPNRKSLWEDAIRSVFRSNEDVIRILIHLRGKGYRLGLISNTEPPAVKYFKEKYRELFDCTIFSCEEKIVKPDRQIYLVAGERLRISPSRTIFIDDNPAYVEGAIKIGMKGIHFKDNATLRRKLLLHGITVE